MSEIHIGDYNTLFKATIKDQDDNVVDISSATSKYLIFEDPQCNIYTKVASLYTDGTDGIIKYNSESGLFNIGGIWQIQGQVSYSDGSWYSDISEFRVRDNLS